MKSLGKFPTPAESNHPTFEIAFETDNVAAAIEKAISVGAKPIQKPETMPWGQTTAYVSDPNGFLIEICTPVS